MGNGSVIRPGDVQFMSAGAGVTHSEFNASETEPLHLLQMWVVPRARGAPRYDQRHFPTVAIGCGSRSAPRVTKDATIRHVDVDARRRHRWEAASPTSGGSPAAGSFGDTIYRRQLEYRRSSVPGTAPGSRRRTCSRTSARRHRAWIPGALNEASAFSSGTTRFPFPARRRSSCRKPPSNSPAFPGLRPASSQRAPAGSEGSRPAPARGRVRERAEHGDARRCTARRARYLDPRHRAEGAQPHASSSGAADCADLAPLFGCSSRWHTRCRFFKLPTPVRAHTRSTSSSRDRRSRGARHVDARGHARACVPASASRRARASTWCAARRHIAAQQRPSRAASAVARAARRASPVDTGGSYLVTGAAGFIGSHLCELLLSRGAAVVAVDNLDAHGPYPVHFKEANLEVLGACARRRTPPSGASLRFVRADVSTRPPRARCSVGDGRTSSGRRLETHQTHHPRLPPRRAEAAASFDDAARPRGTPRRPTPPPPRCSPPPP